MRRIVVGVLFVVCPILTGCNSPVSVEGKVVKDGKPYGPPKGEELNVNLTPEEGTASYSGKVDSSGSFTIQDAKGQGIPSGKYRVTVTHYVLPTAEIKGKAAAPKTLDTKEVWDVNSSNRSFTIDISKLADDKKKDKK